MASKARGGRATAFELIIQDEYLIVRHADLPQLLLLPRGAVHNDDASLGVSVESVADFQHLHGRRMGFDAIYGVFWLLRGPYLAVVTQSKSVAKGVDGKDIRLVQKLELMLIPTQHLPVLTPAQEEDEAKYLAMLMNDIEAQKLHFSRDYDLTHSLQRTLCMRVVRVATARLLSSFATLVCWLARGFCFRHFRIRRELWKHR